MANPFDQFDSPVAQTGKDVALSFGQGAAGLLKSVGDIYGLTTGDMDNVVSRKAQEAIESLQTQKSPEVLQMEEKRRQAVEAETGTLDKAWAYLSNTAPEFRLALGDIAQAAPSVLGTGGAGAAVRAGARMLGAGAKTAAKTGLGGAIATGAGLQAGEAGASQYAELVKTLGEMPDEQKAQIPQIADLMQRKGASLEDATTALLLDLSRDAGVFAALTSAASMAIPGGTSIERSLVGGAAKQPAKSLLSGISKSAAGETGQEVLENIGAEVGKNIFARPVEPEREITRGVGEAMGASVLPALAMGGAAGAAQSISRPEPTPRPAPASQVAAGMSEETPAPAATKPSLAAEQQATLERSEDMTSEQFFATVNVRQARLLGGEPNPEDIKLVGDAPPPRVIIDPDMMRSAIDETQQALNDWRAKNPNAPENMVIVFDPEMLHNGFGIQGAFNQRDGSIFINAAFVAPENVGKIASHEWAHATLASPEGQRAFAEFAAREIPQEDLNALATRYGTQDRMVLLEEWIAENQEKAPGVISRIVARIREWLSGLGILDLSDAEVADIMLRSLREQAENKIQPDTQRVEGGIAPDQNLEVYETFIGNRLDAGPKFALQKLPTAADVTDAKGNLRYTIPKKTLDVSHYSFVPDLTEVDPAYYGTGRGEHYHRMMKGINKSFFFVGNSKPKAHENVAGKGMNRYRTTIDSSRIYDMDKDPLDLWFAPNPQKSEGLLKELGYDGFLAKTDDGRSFVAVFYPTSLETGEMTRAAQPVEEAVSEEPQESAEEYLARVEREEAAERRKALRRASSGKYSLTQEPERISGIMASPSITDIQYDRAKRNLTSANQARFKSQITDYAPDADIFDAVGDWVDGAENSVAAIFRDRKPVDELQRLAAKAGLAGDQKAVLWWSTDPKGVDAIHEIVWPKGVSMDDARQAMIDVGLENRTLIQTPDGIRGFVFDQGRQNLNKIEALHEHETQPSLDSSPASGDFLGSWSSRAEGRRAYRRVLGSTPQTETGAGELRSEQVGTGSEPETRFSLAQTKTPEFKAWFGGSQIVDRNGDPRVMYHGTFNRRNFTGRNEDFTVFRPKSQNEGQPGVVFASPNPQLASEFTGITPSYLEQFSGDELGEKRPGARVYPVYVKAENPFDYENPRHVQMIFGDEDYIELVPGSEEGGPYGSVDYDGVSISRAKVENGDWTDIEYLLGKIKDAGFDGAYVSERDSTGERAKNIAVFDPDQLKSATGNVGAFGQRPVTAEEAERVGMTEEEAAEEQRRGDIRFSLAQTKTPEFRRWFKESVATDENGRPQVYYHGTPDFSGTAFKPSKAINRTGNVSGYYFTPDAEESSFYATGEEGAQVIPVYLSIQNPFIPGKSKISLEMTDQYRTELENANTHLDPSNSWFNSKVTNMVKTGTVSPNALNGDGDAYQRVLKAGGYDGFQDGRHLVAFEPTQIKSSIGNLGTFDPENPDFRYSLSQQPVDVSATRLTREVLGLTPGEARIPRDAVAKALNDFSRDQLKGYDFSNDQVAIAHGILNAVAEGRSQLLLGDKSGADWYDTDIETAKKYLKKALPTLKNDTDMVLFTALMTPTSFGNNPVLNIATAVRIYENALSKGEDVWSNISPRQPDGKGWTQRATAVEKALERLNSLLDERGERGAVNWLLKKHPVSELREYNDNVSGKANDMKYGAYIFGPKGGPFFLNMNGVREEMTKDLWWSRTFNRWFGTMEETVADTDVEDGLANEEGTKVDDPGGFKIQEVPRNDAERRRMDAIAKGAADELGLTIEELQATLWYYEQQLWKRLGAKVESYSFKDGALRILQKRGIEAPRVRRSNSPAEERRQAAYLLAAAGGRAGPAETAPTQPPPD